MRIKTNAQLEKQVKSMSIVLKKLISDFEEMKTSNQQMPELTEAEILISHNYDNMSWEEDQCT